jgi:hypothetical protein
LVKNSFFDLDGNSFFDKVSSVSPFLWAVKEPFQDGINIIMADSQDLVAMNSDSFLSLFSVSFTIKYSGQRQKGWILLLAGKQVCGFASLQCGSGSSLSHL